MTGEKAIIQWSRKSGLHKPVIILFPYCLTLIQCKYDQTGVHNFPLSVERTRSAGQTHLFAVNIDSMESLGANKR